MSIVSLLNINSFKQVRHSSEVIQPSALTIQSNPINIAFILPLQYAFTKNHSGELLKILI